MAEKSQSTKCAPEKSAPSTFDLLNFGIPRSDETCHIAHYATNDSMHVKRLGLLGYLINGFRNLQRLGKSLLAAASKKSRNEEEEGKLDDDIRNVQLTEGIDSPHFVTGGTQDAAPENESENRYAKIGYTNPFKIPANAPITNIICVRAPDCHTNCMVSLTLAIGLGAAFFFLPEADE